MAPTTVTPPIRLARRARHRKPNRRRHVITKVLGLLLLIAAISGSIASAAPRTQAPVFYGITPGQLTQLEAPGYQLDSYVTPDRDAAACRAVLHFHHVNAVPALYGDEALWQSAYSAAMTGALRAGPEVSGVIVHYLREGDQWSWVRAACR
jgi:hypothetical protein